MLRAILRRSPPCSQPTGVYPYPLGAGSARPNPEKGAPETENPLCIGFAALKRGVETQRKTKGQQLKGKIISEFFTLFTIFRTFS